MPQYAQINRALNMLGFFDAVDIVHSLRSHCTRYSELIETGMFRTLSDN